MKPSMLYEALLALIGERVPLHTFTSGVYCGAGKSQIASQVAGDLKYEFLRVLAAQLDPMDLRGLPRISSDSTEWVEALRGVPYNRLFSPSRSPC
jgi:hypothetical protein